MSIDMVCPDNTENLQLKKMRRFYDMFPYPNQSFLFSPRLWNHLNVHGAFLNFFLHSQYSSILRLQSLLSKARFGHRSSVLQLKKEFIHLKKNYSYKAKILLVGCGTDEPLLFRKLHPKNFMVAVDVSSGNLKKARRRLFWSRLFSAFRLKPVVWLCGDATEILEKKSYEKFDYIQCFGVLHHQPNPQKMLLAMSSVLSSEGILRLMIYSHHGRRLERKIQNRFSSLWEKPTSFWSSFLIQLFSFGMYFWQIKNFFYPKASLGGRFWYLGLRKGAVADAFLHPSDKGLPLENILDMLEAAHLQMIYCEAKINGKGLVMGLEKPMETWYQIIEADQAQELMSNPLFLCRKKTLGE